MTTAIPPFLAGMVRRAAGRDGLPLHPPIGPSSFPLAVPTRPDGGAALPAPTAPEPTRRPRTGDDRPPPEDAVAAPSPPLLSPRPEPAAAPAARTPGAQQPGPVAGPTSVETDRRHAPRRSPVSAPTTREAEREPEPASAPAVRSSIEASRAAGVPETSPSVPPPAAAIPVTRTALPPALPDAGGAAEIVLPMAAPRPADHLRPTDASPPLAEGPPPSALPARLPALPPGRDSGIRPTGPAAAALPVRARPHVQVRIGRVEVIVPPEPAPAVVAPAVPSPRAVERFGDDDLLARLGLDRVHR